MSKGKGVFRVNTKDAFAFFILIQFDLFFSKKETRGSLNQSFKNALAFMRQIIIRNLCAVNPHLQIHLRKSEELMELT